MRKFALICLYSVTIIKFIAICVLMKNAILFNFHFEHILARCMGMFQISCGLGGWSTEGCRMCRENCNGNSISCA